MTDSARLTEAFRQIDEANSADPNTEVHEGVVQPKELVYSKRMTAWLERLAPDASETLRLAVRCQHLRRWEIPRSDYPMDRPGYYAWRTTLARFHGDKAAEILLGCGYSEDEISTVRTLLLKKQIKTNSDAQTLEDAAALVFLENHLSDFAARDDMDEEKLVNILRKTWAKMSPNGHEAAKTLDLSSKEAELIAKALAPDS